MSNARILQNVLEDVLGGQKNLPSHYQDFEQLTRDLVRKLADKLVMVDRKTWNEVSRPKGASVTLETSTERYRRFNDGVEKNMVSRGSIPPPRFEDSPPNVNPRISR
jgi:hypothetical protein